MMATAAQTLTSAEEFFEFVHRPENRERRFELERGEIVEMSRPGVLHGVVCANIVVMLMTYARARKRGYVCSNDAGVIVQRDPDTVRGPDVMYFDDAVSSISELESKFGTTPAALAVEVLSPTDRPGKLNQRLRELFAFGTRMAWVVDPELLTVTVYRPGQARRIEQTTYEETEELTGEDALPDFRCRVTEFFAMPGA